MAVNYQVSRIFNRVIKTPHYKRWCASKTIGEKGRHLLSYEQILPLQFRSKPGSGKELISVDLNVRTVQRHDVKPNAPIVLCLHGSPGDGSDFLGLSCNLANHGVRCLAPDFPGCGKSYLHPNDVYSIDYSPAGKEEMLNKIMDGLNIERVDVLVSHSAGSFLGFRATAEMDRIKSAAFLCFLGGKPHRYARPFNVLSYAAKLIKKPVFQPLFLWFLPKIYKIIGFSQYEVQSLQVAVENVVTAEYKKILDHAASIKDQRKPALFAFATTDKIMELAIPFTILSHIGIDQSGIINLCRDNNIKGNVQGELAEREREVNWYYKAIQFDRGGHLLLKTQIPELTKQILQLNQQVQSLPL